MDSILKNVARVGNFSSSKAVALTKEGKQKGTFGAPAKTYIKQVNNERRLNRSLSNEQDAFATTWGHLCERYVFDNVLPLAYRLCSGDTREHRKIKCWVGTPDLEKEPKIVGDLKSPFTLNSFCNYVEPLLLGLEGMDAINHIRENHTSGEDNFWQIVSNACITEAELGQLIVFVPYQSEVEKIRQLAKELVEAGEKQFYWVINKEDEYLPYIPDGGFYKNLNIIEFPVTQRDKDFLTGKVLEAETLLIERPTVYTTLLP